MGGSMTSNGAGKWVVLIAALTLPSCAKPGSSSIMGSAETKNAAVQAANDPIASAEAAAPPAIARQATIMVLDSSGIVKTLRHGNNGWTCFPDEPSIPGPDPACMDPNASKWAEAVISHRPPPEDAPGV